MEEMLPKEGLSPLWSRKEDAFGTFRSSLTLFFFSVTPSCSDTGSQLICLLCDANVRLSSLVLALDFLNVCSSLGEN